MFRYRQEGVMWDQCLVVSCACIMEVEPERIGRLEDWGAKNWFARLCALLEPHGWVAMHYDWRDADAVAPVGYAIACGKSPLSTTTKTDGTDDHAVVALDGQVVHDPDRGDFGIREVDYWVILVPLLKGVRRLRPPKPSYVVDGSRQGRYHPGHD